MSQLTVTIPTIANCRYTGSPITVRVYYDRTFIDDQGNEVMGGAIGSQNFYAEVVCTLVGTNLTVPDLVLTTTDNPQAPLYAQIPVSAIFYQGSTQLDYLFKDFLLPKIFTPTVTLSDLTVWNDAVVITYPSRYFLDRNQMLLLIRSYAAPVNATFITQTPDSQLTNEQALSLLNTGLLKNTTGTGVLTIAIPGTDYMVPGPIGTQGVTMNTSRLLGRVSPGVGPVQEISLGTNLSFAGNVLNATGGGGGGSVNPTENVVPVQRGGFFVDSRISDSGTTVAVNGIGATVRLGDNGGGTGTAVTVQNDTRLVTLVAGNPATQTIQLQGTPVTAMIHLNSLGGSVGAPSVTLDLKGLSGVAEISGTATTGNAQLNIINVNGRQLRLTGFSGLYGEITVGSGGMLAVDAVNGSIEFNTAAGGDLIVPRTTIKENLGTLQKKYKTLHAAELVVETLVAQDTIATIGGRILVGPTTSLTSALAAGAGTMFVKHNEMRVGDIVLMEGAGNTEFMYINSGPTPSGAVFMYGVGRDLDGTGSNDWNAGDAVFNTGQIGDGFIDLYSIFGVKSFNTSSGSPTYQAGPTIVGNLRNSLTYNDWSEHWAIGNLKGVYGYTVDTYAVGLGKYADGVPHITIDSAVGNVGGIRIFNGLNAVIGQWDANGQITVGQVIANQPNVVISAGLLQIRTGTTTVRIQLNADGSGWLANENISWDRFGNMTIASQAGIGGWVITSNAITATGVTLISGANAGIGFGNSPSPPTNNSATVPGIWIDRTGLYGMGNNAVQVKIDAATGLLVAGGTAMTMGVNGLTIKASTTNTPNRKITFVDDTTGNPFGTLWAGRSLTNLDHIMFMTSFPLAGHNSWSVIESYAAASQTATVTLNNYNSGNQLLGSITITNDVIRFGNVPFGGGNNQRMTIGANGGITIGAAPTGGDFGGGTINLQTDIYKNGTAYANPDYAFEHWANGKIERFINKPGAREYTGRLPLAKLQDYLRRNLHLPGFGPDHGHGLFSGSEELLLRLEEAYLYLFDLAEQIDELGGRTTKTKSI